MSCDMSCDCGHVSLHHLRNYRKIKREIKSKKINKKKIKLKKYQGLSIL